MTEYSSKSEESNKKSMITKSFFFAFIVFGSVAIVITLISLLHHDLNLIYATTEGRLTAMENLLKFLFSIFGLFIAVFSLFVGCCISYLFDVFFLDKK